ncbi:MAG: DNA topoisomerase [Acidobacteria bacterium]|nr:MAG: DNA topoisomerase [Acidobacteriota bacterium]
MTAIERLHLQGILRRGTPARGFHFKHADGGKVTPQDLERIEQLKIPPAWKDVAINSAPNGRIQAVGQDAAGRWQYIYHETHVRAQQRKKFERLIRFGESLPRLRTTVARDLRLSGLPKERVMAAILRILSMSFIRPGSEIYATENGSYGIATLRPRHVSVKGDRITFEFPGKSGQNHTREIRDRLVAATLKELLRYSNRRVFKYQGPEGTFIDVTSRTINRYLKQVMGQSFSAKDFRTWAGTLVCACALARLGAADPASTKSIVTAIEETATALGNTPAVSRDAYICPAVISSFEKGDVVGCYFETLRRLTSYRGMKLHRAEKALLRLLKKCAA